MSKILPSIKTDLKIRFQSAVDADPLVSAIITEAEDLLQLPHHRDWSARQQLLDIIINILHASKRDQSVRLDNLLRSLDTSITVPPKMVFDIYSIDDLSVNSPHGLYIPNGYIIGTNMVVQYGLFSDTSVAKEALTKDKDGEYTKIDSDEPLLFAVISRITEKGTRALDTFLRAFIDVMKNIKVEVIEITLANLNLNRLGRSLLSFSVLMEAINYAANCEVALRLEQITGAPALFGIFAGAVAQTEMRFIQTVRKLKKFKLTNRWGRGAKTDLMNNRVAYYPMLSLAEYRQLVIKRTGVDIYA